jgi:hypothetical protein
LRSNIDNVRNGAIAAAVAFVVAIWPLTSRAEIPPERQALILTRALSYDDNLKSRAGDAVVVAVLFKSGNPASEAMADATARAFKALEGVKVQNLPFKTIKYSYTGKDALNAAIGAQGIDALYVCAGLDTEAQSIREVARKDHVLTIGSREDLVEHGMSLGVFTLDSKPTITVNLAASREEGAAFSSELLRLAHVLR